MRLNRISFHLCFVTGFLVLAGLAAAQTNVDYVKLDFWHERASGSGTPPVGRYEHTAVWTGSEMIVWGGFGNNVSGGYFNDGGRYNPAANSWTAVSTFNSPAARWFHTAVWTGSEMIIWGGLDGTNYFNDGGRYNPVSDSWTVVNASGAPAPRYLHTAVWAGSEMIIWGGDNGTNLNNGGRYSPAVATVRRAILGRR